MDLSNTSLIRMWTAAKAPDQYRHLLPELADSDSVSYVPACLAEVHDLFIGHPALTGRYTFKDGSVLYYFALGLA